MSAIHETLPHARGHLADRNLLAHPADVLSHPALTDDEKREVLSAWASDACAVENDPTLRRLPVGALVPLAEILAALRALPADTTAAPLPSPARRRQGPAYVGWHRRRRRQDGDWPGGGAPALALHPVPGLSS